MRRTAIGTYSMEDKSISSSKSLKITGNQTCKRTAKFFIEAFLQNELHKVKVGVSPSKENLFYLLQ